MDNYDVLEVIGEGTYGVVFKCRDKRTDRIVAVKQFKNFQTNAYVRVAMLRELRVEQLLKGEPNVTQLLEAFKQKNRLYLVMEYIPRSLLDVLEEVQHGLPEDSLVVLIFTMLLGIRSCHRNGIIHRDVKPENILVRDDGAASLCDFGFCRPLPRQLQPQAPLPSHKLSISSQDICSSASPMAESGSFGQRPLLSPNDTPQMCTGASVSSGNSAVLNELVLADHQTIMTNYVATRWYRSPEMLLGMPSYTYAVDMWAVGAIMAEAIDGEPLLPGKTELEQLSLIQSRIGDFPAAYEAGVRKRNGGMLRLRSVIPLAAPPQQLRTKSVQHKPRRASDAKDTAQKRTESKQGTSSYLTERYGGRIAKAGMNLLHRLLRIDAAERITVEEALEHPYFDSVRGRFDASANGARRARSSNGVCDEAPEMQALTEETTESTTMPPTATTSCQAPLPSLIATGAVGCTSTFLSMSGAAAGGGSPCLLAAAPPLDEVPFSMVDRMDAGANDDGGPMQMPCGAGCSPSVTSVAWEASSSSPGSREPCAVAGGNSSTTSSSSLSLWTASDTSAEAAPPTDATAEKDHVSLPQCSSVLAPLHPESPKSREAGGHHTSAAACNRADDGGNSSPPQLAPEEANGGVQPVLRRQVASDGSNTSATQRDVSMHSGDCTSASLLPSRQSHHNPRDARQLRHRTSSLESGGSVTAVRGTDSSPTNTALQEPSGAGGAASAAVISDTDVPASLSLLQPRRTTQRRSDGVVDSQPPSSKISAAKACRATSPSSLLAKSYSFNSIPTSRSKALAPNVVQPTSKCDLMQSTPEDVTEKRRHPSGPMSAPRSQGSRGGAGKRAAANSKGAHTFGSSFMTSNALRSARGNPGRTGELSSPSKERRSSVGRRIDGDGLQVVPAAPSCVNATTPASSFRATAQEPAEVSALRRRSTAKSRPPPQPGRRTSTATGRARIANGNLHSPALPKPLLVHSSPEAPASLAVSDARVSGGKKRGLSRVVSPHLPREVRPLPAPERVTLLQEIESLEFLVGTPSAVEVLAPVVAAPVSHVPEHAESDTDAGEGARGRNQGDTRASATARAGHVVPASQPPGMPDKDVRPDGDRGGGNASPSLTLGETRRQCAETASSRASAAKRDKVASGTTSILGDGTAGSELEDHGRQQSFQRPPHPSGTTGGRPLRMDLNSLSGTTHTPSTNITTVGSSRAAPSLIFRSSRTVSSPLKLATIQPSSFTIQGEGELRELSTNGCHGSISASTRMSFTTLSNSAASPPTRRLAPALLRHHHPTTAAGASSGQASTSLGLDPVFGSSAFSAHSPLLAKNSAWSPTLSPNPQKRSNADARRTSIESPIVSLSGMRQQRRLSDIPIELSISEELFADSAAGGPGVGHWKNENTTPLSTTPPITMPEDLETVVLMGTPPAHQRTDQRRRDEAPCTATWSPVRSGTTAMMSSSMPDNSTPFRGLDRDSADSSAPFAGKGSAAKTEVVDITAGTTRHSVTPALFAAAPKGVPTLDEDDVMNFCETPSPLMRGTLEAGGTGSSASTPSRKIPGPSLAPPQPLLGGASVVSAQQLHTGGGRRKSRLVL